MSVANLAHQQQEVYWWRVCVVQQEPSAVWGGDEMRWPWGKCPHPVVCSDVMAEYDIRLQEGDIFEIDWLVDVNFGSHTTKFVLPVKLTFERNDNVNVKVYSKEFV